MSITPSNHRAAAGRLLALTTCVALVMCGLADNATAQPIESPYIELGIDPSAIVTRPLGELASVRGTEPCSETYNGATHVGLGMLGWIAYVLDGDGGSLGSFQIRSLRLSAGLDDLSSAWRSSQASYPAYNDVTGAFTTVETEFATRFELRYLRAALAVEASLGSSVALRLGPSVSIPTSASSTQSETILSPSSATFLDRSQERSVPEGSGEIDDAKVRVGSSLSLVYRLPLGRRLFFEPTLGVDLGITNVQPSWSPLEMRLGISVGYALFADEESVAVTPSRPQVHPELPDVEPPPTEPFAATVALRLAEDRPIELRRQIVARYIPVIPVTFFAPGASSLPGRYRQLDASAAAAFSETSIATAADEAHHDVLNVIGARLRANPSVAATLTGSTSDEESAREALGRSRAETVARYLESVWGISRSRLNVRARLAPAVPTSSATEEGREENRRVDIALSDESLLAPVQQRTVEPVVEPRTIALVADITANRPIAAWTLASVAGDQRARATETSGVSRPSTITWELEQDDRERMLTQGRESLVLVVNDSEGGLASSAPLDLPLRLDTTVTVATSSTRPDNAAEFLLITFEFDQARLTARGRRELETIAGRIGPSSSVSVTGYTDRIGEAEHNLALARERAMTVAALLPKGAALEVRGADRTEAPYSNETPEGRFLSRTVRVVITSPK